MSYFDDYKHRSKYFYHSSIKFSQINNHCRFILRLWKTDRASIDRDRIKICSVCSTDKLMRCGDQGPLSVPNGKILLSPDPPRFPFREKSNFLSVLITYNFNSYQHL